jgi:hypothetical protein
VRSAAATCGILVIGNDSMMALVAALTQHDTKGQVQRLLDTTLGNKPDDFTALGNRDGFTEGFYCEEHFFELEISPVVTIGFFLFVPLALQANVVAD